MTTGSPSLALTANWTDVSVVPTLTNASNTLALSNCGTGYVWNTYWYPYYRPFPPEYWERERRPIRLTMAEVERLRVIAKKDKALKETLEKFTDHIEVIVDFGKKE